MDKLQRVVSALSEACEELGQVMHVLSVDMRPEGIVVHAYDMRDLEQVPGEAVFEDRLSHEYPVRASKKVNGAEFFCLLGPEESQQVM